jgi:GT2 family glycosyltransferase
MISIVMPVYDIDPRIEKMTRKAIKAVKKNTVGQYELIIVLNGSPKFGKYDDLNPIKLPERTSIAAAYNAGFHNACGYYFCCLHNDVFVKWGWNIPLQAEADIGHIAFPRVEGEERDPAPEWMPPGCCFVMTHRDWANLGGYDERFEDLHFEDTDLFYRATKLGMKLNRCDVTVHHRRGVTRFLLPDVGMKALNENLKKMIVKHNPGALRGSMNAPTLSNIGGLQ